MKKYRKLVILLILATALTAILSLTLNSQEAQANSNGLIEVEATAYYDINHFGHGATGKRLLEGTTLAGRKEWLGMSAILYDMDKNVLGIYEFSDVGYGQPTGYGKSALLKGRTLGTIEAGKCIDIYFDSVAKCRQWGRRRVYMQLIKAVG